MYQPLAVTVDRIADAANTTGAEVEGRLDEWAGVFRSGENEVVGFRGLTRQPLDPEYRLDDPTGETIGYAWCAWDTLFLPTVLDRTLIVAARDGLTGDEIRLTVTPTGVDKVTPDDTVVSLTDAFEIGRRWTEDRYGDALATHLSEGRS